MVKLHLIGMIRETQAFPVYYPRAINWAQLNETVTSELENWNVLLVTFMPLFDRFTFPVYKHIGLSMGPNELELCIKARRISKKITTQDRIIRDELMVREVVYPFYLSLPKPDHIITVVKGNQRLDKQIILEKLERLIL